MHFLLRVFYAVMLFFVSCSNIGGTEQEMTVAGFSVTPLASYRYIDKFVIINNVIVITQCVHSSFFS